jgi:hypothetical protein
MHQDLDFEQRPVEGSVRQCPALHLQSIVEPNLSSALDLQFCLNAEHENPAS